MFWPKVATAQHRQCLQQLGSHIALQTQPVGRVSRARTALSGSNYFVALQDHLLASQALKLAQSLVLKTRQVVRLTLAQALAQTRMDSRFLALGN